jgi:hypothetical protein
LEEKYGIIGNLEADIVTLRKDLQQKTCKNRSKVLDNIINSQRPHRDNSGIRYNHTERGSSSKTTDQETQPRIYAETFRGDKKFYREDHRDTPPPRRFRFHNQ